MGSLCSPDNIDPNSMVQPNTTPRNRTKTNEDESVTSYTDQDRRSNVNEERETSKSNTNNYMESESNINIDALDDLEFGDTPTDTNKTMTFNDNDNDNNNKEEIEINGDHHNLSQPVIPDNIDSNTSRSGLKEIQNEMGLTENGKPKKKKGGFQIVVSDADDIKTKNGYSPIPNAKKQTNGTESDMMNNTENTENTENTDNSIEDEEDLILKKKKQKIDPTLGGIIAWKKVGDFSALLPRDVKVKLWNGVFKTDTNHNQPEIKRVSKILRTFVMLQLTREYKKTGDTVPNEIKHQLAGAVKEPSKFITSFLKKDEKFIDQALLTIYGIICQKFETSDDSKKAKYAKKAKLTQDNYAELTREDLKREFNEDDFLKNAFLQYMLYAFQIKLDTDYAKNRK